MTRFRPILLGITGVSILIVILIPHSDGNANPVSRLPKQVAKNVRNSKLPSPVPMPIWNGRLGLTYGQFNSHSIARFSGGISINVPPGTLVSAIEPGTVYNQPDRTTATFGRITIDSGGEKGWTYRRIAPGLNKYLDPTQPRVFMQGDSVNDSNRSLGSVVAFVDSSMRSNLYLEYGNGPSEYLNSFNDPDIKYAFNPSEDPLDRLPSIGDQIKPKVIDLWFRHGTNDQFGDSSGVLTKGVTTPAGNIIAQVESLSEAHCYFRSRDDAKATVIGALAPSYDFNNNASPTGGNSAIDIIAEAYDLLEESGDHVGVKSIGFSIKGVKLGRAANVEKSFDFTGEFAPDVKNGGRQTYESLMDAALVRTVYENDATLQYHFSRKANSFYIVTNTDGDCKVKVSDRSKAWVTAAIEGSPWNAVGAQHAPNNARSSFPDDYYDITVTARDAAGNVGALTKRVLLDNWKQTINATKLSRQQDDAPGLHRFKVSGYHWTANSTVPLYLVESKPGGLSSGTKIADIQVLRLNDLTADKNGNIPETDVTFTLPDNVAAQLQFLADYHNGDGVYQPQLDAVTELIGAQS